MSLDFMLQQLSNRLEEKKRAERIYSALNRHKCMAEARLNYNGKSCFIVDNPALIEAIDDEFAWVVAIDKSKCVKHSWVYVDFVMKKNNKIF